MTVAIHAQSIAAVRSAASQMRMIQLDLAESGATADAALLTPLVLALADGVLLPFRSPRTVLAQVDELPLIEFDTLGLACDVYSVVGELRRSLDCAF